MFYGASVWERLRERRRPPPGVTIAGGGQPAESHRGAAAPAPPPASSAGSPPRRVSACCSNTHSSALIEDEVHGCAPSSSTGTFTPRAATSIRRDACAAISAPWFRAKEQSVCARPTTAIRMARTSPSCPWTSTALPSIHEHDGSAAPDRRGPSRTTTWPASHRRSEQLSRGTGRYARTLGGSGPVDVVVADPGHVIANLDDGTTIPRDAPAGRRGAAEGERPRRRPAQRL